MPPKKPIAKKSKKEDIEIEDVELDESEKLDEKSEVESDDEEKFEDDDDEEELDDDDFIDNDKKECGIETAIEEDNEYFDNEEEIEAQPDTTVEYVKKEDRLSAPKLTKYEMVRILGERTKQLTMGAKPLIKNHKGLPYDVIAEEELKVNMIPYKIRRPMPNGKYELWTLDELNKEHLLSLLN